MDDRIDEAYGEFASLVAALPSFEATLTNEAAVRLKVIDTVLMDVLGWEKSDISPEEQAGDGFYEDCSVKRRDSRRHLRATSHRSVRAVRLQSWPEVGDGRELEQMPGQASIRAGLWSPTPHAACAPGALAIPGYRRAPSLGTVTMR